MCVCVVEVKFSIYKVKFSPPTKNNDANKSRWKDAVEKLLKRNVVFQTGATGYFQLQGCTKNVALRSCVNYPNPSILLISSHAEIA